MIMNMATCVCVCACVRACVCACVCVCVRSRMHAIIWIPMKIIYNVCCVCRSGIYHLNISSSAGYVMNQVRLIFYGFGFCDWPMHVLKHLLKLSIIHSTHSTTV